MRALSRDRPIRYATGIGVAGALLCVLGALLDPRRAAFSYLAAWATALTIALGALSLVMIANLTGATWFCPLRPLAAAVARTIPALAVLFLPLLLAPGTLYPWAGPPAALSAEARHDIAARGAYHGVPFFLLRAALYFAVWIGLALFLARVPAGVDPIEGTGPPARRQRALSAVGLIAFAFTFAFAAIDWLMSLSPAWSSTIYGIDVWAGGVTGALALVAVLGYLAGALDPGRSNSLAQLVLTFILFWAYLGYSQLLVIWIGNLPAEIPWYLFRLRGSWGGLGLVLLVGHLFVPFLALLRHAARRSPAVVAGVGVWLLAMHWLDVYWLVMPQLTPAGLAPSWLDLAALAAVGGIGTAYGGWKDGLNCGRRTAGRGPGPRFDGGSRTVNGGRWTAGGGPRAVNCGPGSRGGGPGPGPG